MCSKISLGIKEKNLSRNSFPKLIVGTGLSASFGVPGMSKLSTQLEKNLSRHPDSTIRDLWLKKADDVKQYGLEEGLKSLAPTEERLVEEIRKVTAAFILQEEEKLHKQIANADSGFAKLLKYLKETCSVNHRILDIMTPNYDRIIEIICDSLGIGVITGFEGEVYESFQPWVLKNPEKYYHTKRNFYVRLFKPHGSINWIRKNEIEYLSNILEKATKLPYSNIIVFDLHGEYNELSYADQIKITDSAGGLCIPLWFFNYEEIHSLFIESSEGTSTNQRAAVVDYILKAKKEYIKDNMKQVSEDIVTADTPVPFSALGLKVYLEQQNMKEEGTGEFYKSGDNKGQEKKKRGQYYDKLTNLITRLQTKMDDKKYGFVFNEKGTENEEYLKIFDIFVTNGIFECG